MVTEQELRELTDFAQEIRIWTIRQMAERGFGHMGGAMSICDLLSVLYGMRRRFVLRAIPLKRGTGWYDPKDMQGRRCMRHWH